VRWEPAAVIGGLFAGAVIDRWTGANWFVIGLPMAVAAFSVWQLGRKR
jgi:hypothetical protein